MFKSFKRDHSNQAHDDALLSAYLDDELAAPERARLEARLAAEPALRDQLQGLRRTVEALASLPTLEVPRNFILSPAMVADARPAPQPRRRLRPPVLGWATAVATLLFLFVLAGDFLFVAPASRDDLAAPTTPERELFRQATGVAEAPVAEAEQATSASLGPTAEAAPAEEAPAEAVEVPAPQLEKDQARITGAEPSPPGAAEGVSESLPAGVAPSVAAAQAGEDQAPSERQAVPTPGSVVTLTDGVETAFAITPGLATDEDEAALPPAVPSPDRGAGANGDAAADVSPEETPLALEPVGLAPTDAGDADLAARLAPWLRVAEVGLGVLVAGLAMATWIARRHTA